MQPLSPANPQAIAASTPANTRIYAIGDIHGRADLLIETIARIDDDLERRPIAHAVEVYLGDYIDRGPDSKTVVDLLAVRLVEHRAVCLRGNHEALMENFLRDPANLRPWLQLGGMHTLASYGVSVHPEMIKAEIELHRRFFKRFSRDSRLVPAVVTLPLYLGDFLFF